MVDFSRLSANWRRWAPGLGSGNIDVVTGCRDCLICFKAGDYSVHLREEANWWIVDTVNDRGQRRSGDAKLSNFDLVERYLIWDWATAVRSDLASGRRWALILPSRDLPQTLKYRKLIQNTRFVRTMTARSYLQ
jgi:hypothetical protein